MSAALPQFHPVNGVGDDHLKVEFVVRVAVHEFLILLEEDGHGVLHHPEADEERHDRVEARYVKEHRRAQAGENRGGDHDIRFHVLGVREDDGAPGFFSEAKLAEREEKFSGD